MKNPAFPDDTLLIDISRSSCNNCGKGVHPDSPTHAENDGWAGGGEGCHILFTYVASNYIGIDGLQARIKEMRPDLEWVGYDITEFLPDT